MSKLTESARNRECEVRLHVCNFRPETTVAAHFNGGGMAMKNNDMFSCFACSSCHAWLDGGYVKENTPTWMRDLAHLEAIIRTQAIWLKEGLIEVKGDKTKKTIEYYKNNV